MEAMILAAGLGTRLRPLTDTLPKALIPVGGRPLLEHVVDRLAAAGVTRIVINTCPHADQIRRYVEANTPPGMEIALSPEPDGPYDTGGGLLAAAPLFRRDGPFLLHNVDVLSRIPLDALLAAHLAGEPPRGNSPVATVAVQARDSRRQLLFDDRGLMGWENREADGTVRAAEQVREPVGTLRRWSFTGIHALEPAILDLAERQGVFSIITWYLDLARRGHAIFPFDASGHAWLDVGTMDRLAEAESAMKDDERR